MKNSNTTTILFLGSVGFPFGSATIQRQIQLAKSLLESDFEVVVINTRSPHSRGISKREKISNHGFYQGIEYFYSSILPYRSNYFLLRNAFKLIGFIIEFFAILYFRLFRNSKYIFYRANKLSSCKYYFILSKIFRIKLVYDYVEFYDSLGNRDKNKMSNLKKRFDYTFFNYTDKLIVISDFLENHLKKINANKPTIKIPPIIDFSYFDGVDPKKVTTPFFLFCGSAAYEDIIKFIIEVYINSNAKLKNYELKLVINGTLDQLEKLNQFINENRCHENVEILSNLSYLDLVNLYKSAWALLIPIGNNIQDQARFPFKICEYTASKRPIITSDSGAIKEYFDDGLNAFIAKTDSLDDFTRKLNLVMDQKKLSNRVGLNGYRLGKMLFNYKTYSDDLKNFILS